MYLWDAQAQQSRFEKEDVKRARFYCVAMCRHWINEAMLHIMYKHTCRHYLFWFQQSGHFEQNDGFFFIWSKCTCMRLKICKSTRHSSNTIEPCTQKKADVLIIIFVEWSVCCTAVDQIIFSQVETFLKKFHPQTRKNRQQLLTWTPCTQIVVFKASSTYTSITHPNANMKSLLKPNLGSNFPITSISSSIYSGGVPTPISNLPTQILTTVCSSNPKEHTLTLTIGHIHNFNCKRQTVSRFCQISTFSVRSCNFFANLSHDGNKQKVSLEFVKNKDIIIATSSNSACSTAERTLQSLTFWITSILSTDIFWKGYLACSFFKCSPSYIRITTLSTWLHLKPTKVPQSIDVVTLNQMARPYQMQRSFQRVNITWPNLQSQHSKKDTTLWQSRPKTSHFSPFFRVLLRHSTQFRSSRRT